MVNYSLHQLQENVFLKKSESQCEGYLLYVYEISVERLSQAKVLADFSDSVAVTVEDSSSMFKEAHIQPFEGVEIARVRLHSGWKLKTKFKITLVSPPKEVQQRWIRLSEEKLIAAIRQNHLIFQKLNTETLPVNFLISRLVDFNINFVDPEFSPCLKKLNFSQEEEELQTLIEWRRPTDFFSKLGKYDVFVDISPRSVIKGMVENNQLVSILKAISLKPEVVKRLFITQQKNDEGIYRLSLYQQGLKRQVTLDDYIPCFPLEKPYLIKNQTGDFWPMLIQKALAKLMDGYSNFKDLRIQSLLLDLTGCPGQSISLRSEKQAKEVLKLLAERITQNAIAVCWQTPQEWHKDSQLPLPDFAYPLVKANPGKGTLTFLVQETLKEMSYDQARQHFQRVFLVRTQSWLQVRLKGKFIWAHDTISKEQYFISKWCYSFQLTASSKIIIGLHQELPGPPRSRQRKPLLDIALYIFKKSKLQGSEVVLINDFALERQQFVECELEAGEYLVVPRSTGCRMFCPDGLAPLISLVDSHGKFQSEVVQTIRDIFYKFDLFYNNILEYYQFKNCLEYFRIKTTKEQYLDLAKRLEEGVPGQPVLGFSFKGFLKFWELELEKEGEPRVWELLDRFGYSRTLKSTKSRMFGLTFHSTEELFVVVRDNISNGLDYRSNLIQAKNKGQPFEASPKGVTLLISQSKQNSIFSYAVRNQLDVPIVATLDVSKSIRALFSDNRGLFRRRVEAGETQFLGHVMSATGEKKGFSKSQSFSYNNL